MIVCSTCKHANMAGAMFCAECGAQLVGRDSLITQTITTDNFKRVNLGGSQMMHISPLTAAMPGEACICWILGRSCRFHRVMNSPWDALVKVSPSCQILTFHHIRRMLLGYRAFML
jgi:uncharacterized membrane protein YvbJ